MSAPCGRAAHEGRGWRRAEGGPVVCSVCHPPPAGLEVELVDNLVLLADEIRAEHDACEHAALSAIEHAIRAGRLLIEAKARVRHGEWLPWLAEHFPASVRVAQNYMRLAMNAQTSAHFNSVDAALKALAEPQAQEQEHPALVAGAGIEPPTVTTAEVVDAEIVEPPPALRPEPEHADLCHGHGRVTVRGRRRTDAPGAVFCKLCGEPIGGRR